MKRRLGIGIATGVCFLAAVGAVAAADQTTVTTASVGAGQVDGRSWEVLVDNEEPGICFEAAVMTGEWRRENGVGFCSYPAVRRGILLVVPDRPRRESEPVLVTAVGGAFNPAVKRVVAEKFGGKRVVLPLHRLTTMRPIGVARRFRYLSFGVKGPWCARAVTTYGGDGAVLHRFELRPSPACGAKRQRGGRDLPKVVLVHGAWADGSCWSAVIAALQAPGYDCIAPQFPETSTDDDVARLRQALDRSRARPSSSATHMGARSSPPSGRIPTWSASSTWRRSASTRASRWARC